MIAIQQHLIKVLRKLQNNGSSLSLGSNSGSIVSLEDILKHVQQRLNSLPPENNPLRINSVEAFAKPEKKHFLHPKNNNEDTSCSPKERVANVSSCKSRNLKETSFDMTPVRTQCSLNSTNLNQAANVNYENGAKLKPETALLSRLNGTDMIVETTVDNAVSEANIRSSAHDERKQIKSTLSNYFGSDFSHKYFLQENRITRRTARNLRPTNFIYSLTVNSGQETLQSKRRTNLISSMEMSSSTASAAQSHQNQHVPEENSLSTHCTSTLSFMSESNSSATPTSGSGHCDDNIHSANPCFNNSLADIVQFMEIIGNLKHTKRTGWVLRGVNDCESISGHMYRMSILTFLLDGSEGLNQIRCMELALVHDLAESLVGDITPFCGVSKDAKRAMEFKAMADICKLIEPRGKRIMELFEEYELGESAESKFVKDLDRLDMIMQAFEYEKRDNCLLKHQEFFDSTAGKFKHSFVRKLVEEIYKQRNELAELKGATPPPKIEVPNIDAEVNDNTLAGSSLNGRNLHTASNSAIKPIHTTSSASSVTSSSSPSSSSSSTTSTSTSTSSSSSSS